MFKSNTLKVNEIISTEIALEITGMCPRLIYLEQLPFLYEIGKTETKFDTVVQSNLFETNQSSNQIVSFKLVDNSPIC